jgi:hypothetical protein
MVKKWERDMLDEDALGEMWPSKKKERCAHLMLFGDDNACPSTH